MFGGQWIEVAWQGVNKMHTGTVAGRIGDYLKVLTAPGRYVLVHIKSVRQTNDPDLFTRQNQESISQFSKSEKEPID